VAFGREKICACASLDTAIFIEGNHMSIAEELKTSMSRAEKLEGSRLAVRAHLWPNVDPARLWSRKSAKGFATVPRTMPLLMQVMDRLNVGKPVSSVYLDLFCRAFDESFVRLDKAHQMAFSAGFVTARGPHTWAERLDLLKREGFIDIAPGPFGPRSFALILNPYFVVQDLHKKGRVEKALYNALVFEAESFGAKDLELATALPSVV
jgi:hypothetical protein